MLCSVIDDYLPDSLHDHVCQCVLNNQFPWFYLEDITREFPRENEYRQPGLQNTPYAHGRVNNQFYDSISFLPSMMATTIQEMTKYSRERLILTRLRVGLNHPIIDFASKFEVPYNFPHRDYDEEVAEKKHFTLLYYVNESDGDTYVFEEQKELTDITQYTIHKQVTPKQNRLLVFDGEQYHASSSPLKCDRRVVITVNFMV